MPKPGATTDTDSLTLPPQQNDVADNGDTTGVVNTVIFVAGDVPAQPVPVAVTFTVYKPDVVAK